MISFSISSIACLEASTTIFLGAAVQAGTPMISLPRVPDGSVAGVITGVRIRIVAGVITGVGTGEMSRVLVGAAFGKTVGLMIVFGEISGEKTLPLQVTLLVPTILSISGSVTSAFSSSTVNGYCLMPR